MQYAQVNPCESLEELRLRINQRSSFVKRKMEQRADGGEV